jgi:hypothetical protein
MHYGRDGKKSLLGNSYLRDPCIYIDERKTLIRIVSLQPEFKLGVCEMEVCTVC